MFFKSAALRLDKQSRRVEKQPCATGILEMKIEYFEDTATLYLVFKESEIDGTRDLDENTLIEFDAQGNLVSMTIEHARERADVANFSFHQVPAMKPVA